MSISGPETGLPALGDVVLPSPECTLPSPAEVTEAVLGMQTRIFEAAQLSVPTPEQGLERSNYTTWKIKGDDVEASVEYSGSLGESVAVADLPNKNFAATIRTGEVGNRKGARFDFYSHDGDDLKYTVQSYSGRNQVIPAQVEAGLALLRAFLVGKVTADTQECGRRVDVFGDDGSKIAAMERVLQVAGQPSVTSITLEVVPHMSGLFWFRAHVVAGRLESVSYKDRRDYDGVFGIIGKLTCWPNHEGLSEIRALYPGEVAYTPERTARDKAIDAARYTLTRGRLAEVHLRGEAALRQLAAYRQAS